MLTKTNKQNISFFIWANLKKLLTDFINFSTTDTTSNKLKACSSSLLSSPLPRKIIKSLLKKISSFPKELRDMELL